ncbi:MAG: transglutaminase family protein [Prolixibacteraceae bacterium]|nr:transglutaminase family protein [Prolixibacteraceae bacterium]
MIANNTKALINLLDDPDVGIYKMIEQELVKKNASIIPVLEEKWENSLDEICQQRIENLIQFLHVKDLKKQMRKWVRGSNPDLLEGFFILNKFLYPDLNLQIIERQIEKLQKDIWLELNDSLTSLEKTSVLNHVFFELHGFAVNHTNLNDPDHCYLNKVLESKKGNSYSIAVIYAILAEKLELPVHFIDFPRNPLLAWFDHEIAVEAHGENIDTDIIFYINPSNKGSITGRKELEYHLKKIKFTPDPKYYRKGDNRIFILRLANRLEKAYKMMGLDDKSGIIYELKIIIADYLGMNL